MYHWEFQLHFQDECDGGKMAGVNYNLESSKKLKHKLSDMSNAMENEDGNGEVDSPD